ncbi:MBOAT family O-acyltransferase [Clostridium fungisolvens]|nr:MBOAT family O-acyltransferase [Clostridium fungisolvens]
MYKKIFKTSKIIVFIAVCLNILILAYFKYFNFSISIYNDTIGNIIDRRIHIRDMIIPLGISYITFQQISYIVDVYRDVNKVMINFFEYSLYVLFFPRVIAGPIIQYSDLRAQLRDRIYSVDKFSEGIYRFSIGLGKKVILSSVLEDVANRIFAMQPNELGFIYAWFGAIVYTLQIYLDFSGYSDMAIGIGYMIGFKLPENFNRPYISKSISEFWKRWHISLTSFFRQYVYIPLGGNRGSYKRTLFNNFIIFFISGLWHGANYTFIVWGIYYGVLIILERIGLKKYLDKLPGFLSQVITFVIVAIGWVIFRSDNISYAWKYIKTLFNLHSYENMSFLKLGADSKFWIIFVLSLIISILPDLSTVIRKKMDNSIIYLVKYVFSLIILIYSIAIISTGTFNPFIYFKF